MAQSLGLPVRHASRVAGFAALCACSLLAGSAHGERYFPVEEGIIWRYDVQTNGASFEAARQFLGTAPLNGTTTHIMHHTGGIDDGLQQYWSEDAEGDVRFHGFTIPDFSVFYTPPILWYDAPLFVGKTWETRVQSDLSPALDVRFEVIAQGPVTVAAGTFDCFTIEWTSSKPEKASRFRADILGRRSASQGEPEGVLESLSDGVGLVQSGFGSLPVHSLRSIEAGTAVQVTTWSSIRRLYQ